VALCQLQLWLSADQDMGWLVQLDIHRQKLLGEKKSEEMRMLFLMLG
jgi:hypothetical protein